MKFRFEKAADDHAANGGDTLEPRICTISFPGIHRGILFTVLRCFGFILGIDGDIHAMNDNSFGQGGGAVAIPIEWHKCFIHLESWKEFLLYLRSFRKSDGSMKFTDGTAPGWFVEHWALAAWKSAHRTSTTGVGIVILKLDQDYSKSVWCNLEFLFCKCLAQIFPNSVYVVFGEWFQLEGFYMKGNERL